MSEEYTYDSRLQLPNHALFIGQTMSGKTRLVLELLNQIERLNPIPKLVLFYYDQYQESYEILQKKLAGIGVSMCLRQGNSVTLDDIEKHDFHTLVIIDDATEETASSAAIAKITTNGRHKLASLWLIWHSLFSKHPASRLITANVGYLFFLPSVRLTSQLKTLDTQLAYKGKLVEAYQAAIDEEGEHRYLMLDLSTRCPSHMRLRSSVHNSIQYVYV